MARFSLIFVTLSVLIAGRAFANSEYDPDACSQVLGTLNIHWEAVSGVNAPCTGIEFTDGTLLDAADGSITMSGTSVSGQGCIATDNYTLSMSIDGLALSGNASAIPMNLTRAPGQACFVGHWVDGSNDYLAHIAAAPFGGSIVSVGMPVPTLSAWAVGVLVLVLFAVGRIALFKREGDYS
jgi:hypothetical protein